ncbi:hypothetical protein M408DRAFT_331403 [Serendipita vermifera MAFF 305830]|uniref:Uncharacterized protein n=1 Tax=Serendipita vermifera MAFF 305830 TaxID=933852 RepID=A0A0C3AYS3_SERVB|nr:hypothetical protein M408DRAFT_331403 [Serendipita vermifera MAFF 305830]
MESNMVDAIASGAKTFIRHLIYSEEANLNMDIQHQQRSLEKERAKIQVQEDQKESLDDKLAKWNFNMVKIEQDIGNVDQDITAIRVYAPDDGALTKHDIISRFKDLCSNINGLYWSLEPKIDQSSILSRDGLKQLLQVSKDLGSDAAVFVARSAEHGSPVLPIMRALLRHCFTLLLVVHIFKPFVPGISEDDSNTFYRIYCDVRSREPQNTVGRWRAMTVRYAMESRKSGWYTDHVTTHIHNLKRLLIIIKPDGEPEEYWGALTYMATQLFDRALTLKNDMMLKCTEDEGEIYLPTHGSDFNCELMKEFDNQFGDCGSESVVLGTGLGLKFLGNVEEKAGYQRHRTTSLYVEAVGNRNPLLSSYGLSASGHGNPFWR